MRRAGPVETPTQPRAAPPLRRPEYDEDGRPIAPQGPRQNAFPLDCAASTELAPCTTSPIATACCTPRRWISRASREAVGTPFYCYSTATLERHYRVFAEAFADVPSLVCYAMKANSNQAVIATLARLGAGADVVSGGELKRALAAGMPPDKIMFSGIGKTAAELALALDDDILCVNVESEPELELLSAIAAGKGRTAHISVRVNPDVDAKTHAKIATGKSENKFGIPISRAREVYAQAAKLPGLRVAGVDMHIGSQITELAPFDDAFALLSGVRARAARRRPHDLACRSRRRPRHSLSRRQRAAARSRGLCRGGQARDARARLQADLRARPPDRRQCRHPGHARALS